MPVYTSLRGLTISATRPDGLVEPVPRQGRSLILEVRHQEDRVLTILRRDFDHAMALCGCRTVNEVTGDLLRP